MREWINLVEGVLDEAVDYAAYQSFGISPEDADRFARYKIGAEDAAFYIKLGKGIDGAFERIEHERIRGVLRRAEDRAGEKLISALPALHKSSGPISYQTACALIASDDELFGMVLGWTQNADFAEERPELSVKFLAVLKRIKPLVRKQLFRGQMPFHSTRSDQRGFHSWSANLDTAKDFAERHGHILEIDRPIQGVALGDICTWRMRLHPGESYYSGPQAEWFVVDQPEQFAHLHESASSKLIADFTEGYCYALALELNNHYRWPISVVADEDEKFNTIHAFNLLPDGRAFDINGPQSVDDLLASYAGNESGWRTIQVTRLKLLDLLNSDLRRMTIHAKDYAQKTILQYLKPTYPEVFQKKRIGESTDMETWRKLVDQSMTKLVSKLKKLPIADKILVFGSVSAGKEHPGDIDLFVDLSEYDNALEMARPLLALAREFYGSLDPFVMVTTQSGKRGLLTRDDNAQTWEWARNARPIAKAGRAGTPLVDARWPKQWLEEDTGTAAIPADLAAKILSDPRCKRGVKIPTSAALWRGEGDDSGSGMASYGLGFYFTADKRGAAMYGDVSEVSKHMLPENALRFDTKNDFQIWLQQAQRLLGYASNLDFAKVYHDFGQFIRALDPSCEGIQMFTGRDAIFVNWAVEEGRPE